MPFAVANHSVKQAPKKLSKIEHLSEPAIGARTQRNASPFDSGLMRRKLVAYALAALMVVAMAMWISGLSWALLALVHWGLDRIQSLWALF
jgi:hypothetical protein